jgi:hypothetical protein
MTSEQTTRSCSCLGGNGLDLEHGAGQLARLGVHGGRYAQRRERAADDAAGEPEELKQGWLSVMYSRA